MPQKTYHIKGMHCASCEIVIERELLKADGVRAADASMASGRLTIEYDGQAPSPQQLNDTFQNSGYRFSESPFTEGKDDLRKLATPLLLALAVIAAFLLLNRFGLSSFINVDTNSSVFAFFVFGLIAGVSSCAALIGGLVLSLSKGWSRAYFSSGSIIEKAKPNLLFNAGRLLAYWLFGLLLGLLGEKLNVSPTFTSTMVVIVSVVMAILALQMLGIGPFNRLRFALPKSLTGKLAASGEAKGRLAPLGVGFLTVLLPCGFTVIAEGMAILSGDPILGSMIMLFFALGTAIPLMAIGTLSAKLMENPRISANFLKVAGILIIFFVLFNINTQFSLTARIFSPRPPLVQDNAGATTKAREIKAVYTLDKDIVPSDFQAKVGEKTRLLVDVRENGYGCMSTIMIPGLYDKPILLRKGQGITMEFTAKKPGRYLITCAMGVPRGAITVTE